MVGPAHGEVVVEGSGGGVLHIPSVKATTWKSEQQRCSCATNKRRSWLLS